MTGSIYGYVRVSTREQNEDRQLSLVREDLFKSVRIGNAIRISKRSFDHWLESLDL